MPRSRTPSRSPVRQERRQAYSPRRHGSRAGSRDSSSRKDAAHNERPRRNDAGFRWKEKRRDEGRDDGDSRRLDRGYRQRNRSRSPMRERPREQRGANRDQERDRGRDREREGARPTDKDRDRDKDKDSHRQKESIATSAPSGEPMIVINVNDRLGTKAAIPCLASDPVGLFKAQVAARIGRQPHEILLKRQGERPFKDALTLEDYGVSNGVQLDLELDAGD
ncbi:MAG: hypothetical protein M1815_000618 [Lichina confinis]|nr:MAG: hypothetical protein M1815_000618 [Lichina confinis]